MTLNRQQFQELRNEGLSVDQIVKFDSGSMPTVASVPLRGGLGEIRGEVKEEPKKNFFQRIFGKEGRIEERGENVADILQESGKQSTLSTGFQVFAQNLGLMKDVAFEGVVSAFRGVSNITPDFIEKPLVDAVKQSAIETFETFKNSPEGQQAFQKLGEGLESYKLWAKDHPEAHRNLVAAGETVDFALQGLGVGKVKKILKEPVKQGIETGVKTVQKVAKETVKAGEKVAKTTENAFDTAVRSLSTAKEKVGVLGGAVKEAGLGLKSKATGLPERLEINIKVKQEARKAFNELPPVEKKAVTQGILVRDANLINTSSDGNKIVMREILDSAKKFESNRLSSARPSAVLGTEFRKRLTGLKDEVSKAGKAMGEMVKDIPKTSVTGVKESVLKRMKEVLGLSELKLVNGKLNFTDTTLAGSLTASDRRIIQSVFDDLANKNAFQLHQLRRELFEDLGGRKLSGLKLTETQEKGVNAIRKGIADILEGVSPKYKATNQSYTQLAEMQKNIKKMFGDVAEGGEDIFDAKSSILLRRLTSNTKSGQDIASLIKEVEDLLKVKGINFDTDIGALQEFVNIINRYYDVAGDTSLLGILRTKDIPLKPSSAIAKVLEGVIDAGSITDDTAKQAIDDLLKLSK